MRVLPLLLLLVSLAPAQTGADGTITVQVGHSVVTVEQMPNTSAATCVTGTVNGLREALATSDTVAVSVGQNAAANVAETMAHLDQASIRACITLASP